ncbi:MAG: pseudouridine synthase [Planctomycetes bacterium]|nr:pseudouridine synthase [Planctomycetota bacterium]
MRRARAGWRGRVRRCAGVWECEERAGQWGAAGLHWPPMKRQSRNKRAGRASDDPLRDASRGVRLHKALADAGVGSRRACEAMIDERRVTVNGRVIDFKPVFVDPNEDKITIDGVPLAKPRRASHLYLMINKPSGVICTNSDELGRRRIVDLVPHDKRLFCVGRLDADSTGLVLLTDDGDLANHLTHPRYEIAKTYEVTINGLLEADQVEKLRRGIHLADRTGQTVKASAESIDVKARDRERTRLTITLREGRNREIRRMLARLGFKVKRLKRTALGPLNLKGVAVGGWRALTNIEVNMLRRVAKAAEKRL